MNSFDEIKSLFEEDTFDVPSKSPSSEEIGRQSQRLQKLEKVLESYMGYWEEWKSSKGCFLTDREVMAIEYYKKYQTHSTLANEIKLSPSRISAMYNKALRRLQNNEHLFRHWIANKIFTQAGLHQQLGPKEEFLMRPIHEHKLSKGLYLLISVEAENLSELLQLYSEPELAKIRGFGKRKLDELKALLKSNSCSSLLRKK